ncbi:MAG: clan AA aspartic protease [Bacteroidia bacterium]|jgi:clan AA aspartic protease|nr:clan AA aspartic protease [Bacteroidia bacterium]
MGLVYGQIELSNPKDEKLLPIEVQCLVDTGSTYLCIPESVAIQLQLKELEKREVMLADGSIRTVSYVGPVKISFVNRSCFVGAMVMGDQTLLGAIPMEDMDLVVHPGKLKLTVNPEHPNIAVGYAKKGS